jgi:hypothetical protein
VVLDCENPSSMKRWSMFTLCVAEPDLTSVTRVIVVLSDVTWKLVPISMVDGALVIFGRGLKSSCALKRYGG